MINEQSGTTDECVQPPNSLNVDATEGALALGQQWASVWQSKYQHLGQLAISDMHLAASTAMWMVALTLLGAAFAFTAWLLTLATAWQLAAAAGLHPGWIGLGAVGLNVVAGAIAIFFVARLGRYLTMPYLREALHSQPENGQ